MGMETSLMSPNWVALLKVSTGYDKILYYNSPKYLDFFKNW